MSYRKKRLLFIQLSLLTIALVLFYVFYFNKSIDNEEVKKNNLPSEDINEDTNSNFFEDVEYRGIDSNGNRYLLRSKKASFNKDKPELINMIGMNAIFYFKDGKILEVIGENGKYNNKTNDMEFRQNVRVNQDKNKITADNLDYFNVKKLIKVYGNVEGESLDGNFTADVLNLNINNQSVDFLMNNNEQVKINLKRWKKVLE